MTHDTGDRTLKGINAGRSLEGSEQMWALAFFFHHSRDECEFESPGTR